MTVSRMISGKCDCVNKQIIKLVDAVLVCGSPIDYFDCLIPKYAALILNEISVWMPNTNLMNNSTMRIKVN